MKTEEGFAYLTQRKILQGSVERVESNGLLVLKWVRINVAKPERGRVDQQGHLELPLIF
jgi:hypothetical protein